MWADITARRQTDGSLLALSIVVKPPEVRLKGPLTAQSESGVGAWTIAGQMVIFTADTVISERSGPVVVGGWVEVYALEEPAGVLQAVRVRGIEAAEDAEVYGAIQGFSPSEWTLSAIPLAATPGTLVMGTPRVGLLAQAAASLSAGSELTARVLNVAWQEPGGNRERVQHLGLVEAMPDQGLEGQWTIGGQTVDVTRATQMFQVKGLAQVGARVQVSGWREDNHLAAASITVLAPASSGGQPFNLQGAIETLPPQGMIGAWTIGGRQVQVTEQTHLYNAQQAQIGAEAEAGGFQVQNNLRVLTWLRVRQAAGPGPQPSATPRPSETPGNGGQPSATPRPSETPGNGGQPSATPRPSETPGNGGQPSATPRPSETPGNGGQPSATPRPSETPGNGGQPSATPRPSETPGNGGQPSATPRPSETPGNGGQPSATPRPSETPWATHTPCGTCTPQTTRTPAPQSLSSDEIRALEAAVYEEYLALNTYQAVLMQLGNITPFSRIALSEAQHVASLNTLFTTYGLTAPANPGLTPAPLFANRRAACQAGVNVETADAALYDVLQPVVAAHSDIVQVFTNLQMASLTDHLPAFDACN